MSDPVVRSEVRDAVAWITLDRPDALNTINNAMRVELPAAVAAADADPAVRVIVVRGAGERAFCAGADVKEFAKVDSTVEYRQNRLHRHWIAPFDQAVKPIIASIHGYCLGGGLEIALACDVRVAAEDAQLALPELTHATITGAGASQRLARVVGLGRALDIMLFSERISAQEARAIGLVTRVFPRASLDEETGKLAATLASRSPLAVQFAKEAIRKGAELPYAEGRRLEIDLLTHLLDTEDRREAGRAFAEKRKPQFKGR